MNHTGDDFLNWRRTHAAAAGAVLLDDIPPPLREAVLEALRSS